MPSLGEAEMTIKINEEMEIPITVQVVDSIKEELLLGTSFLVKTKGIMDFENEKLTLKYNEEQIEIPIYYRKRKGSSCRWQALGCGIYVFFFTAYLGERSERIIPFVLNE